MTPCYITSGNDDKGDREKKNTGVLGFIKTAFSADILARNRCFKSAVNNNTFNREWMCDQIGQCIHYYRTCNICYKGQECRCSFITDKIHTRYVRNLPLHSWYINLYKHWNTLVGDRVGYFGHNRADQQCWRGLQNSQA